MNKMKTRHFILMEALMVTALAFTACSSSDDALEGEELGQGTVKAEFTISIPQQTSGFTRQSLDIVQGQGTPVFRGIQDIKLLPFSMTKEAILGATASSITTPSAITLSAGTAASTIGASSTAANAIASSGALFDASKSHLYKNITINIGTRAFMFYGVAIPKASSTNAVNGALTPATGSTLDKIGFSPVAISTLEEPNTEAKEIAQYLTDIANVKVGTEPNEVTTLTYFPNFTDLKTGSWASVKAAVQQMYISLLNNTDELSEAIKNKIKTKATANETTGELTFTADYSYPRNIGLPDGAAYVQWDSTNKKFNALTQDNMGMNISTLNTYAYPASLYYYGLSNIKTTSASMESKYNGSKTWTAILDEYDNAENPNTVVQSTTRSIAITDPVQYAVGRLDVTVSTKNGQGYLLDNNDQQVTFTNGTHFPITGILVSNQKPVDYKFQTATGTAYTVYDSQVVPEAETENVEQKPYLYAGTTYPAARKTHTLVLETLDAASDDDTNANVNIAVEFENNTDKTIVGKDGQIIYPGTKFYLIGKLQPNKNTTQTYTGTSNLIKKAFVQDYITTANFKVESFKNAYNLLPDLRTPSLEIGLSVDLTWQTGISQDITIE